MAAPEEYTDLILVPAILHIGPLAFLDYPPALQQTMRLWLRYYIAGGQGLNPMVVKHDG